LEDQADDEYVVFEQSRSQYERTKDKIMTRLYLYRKCAEYPKGYFYLTTRSGILEQGELPDGIFPLLYAGFDYFQTKRRAAAILRVSRPYQAEINRASSHIAQHQITVGDDKILYQSGTKLAAGSLLPGVRGLTYQGAKPEVLPGRSGDQYANYVLQQIEEMYQAVNMQELLSEKSEGQAVDPYAMLFRSAKHKRFFASYAKKFERYITDFVTTLLEMYQYYLPDDELIPMLGRAEMVNIGEFKSSNPLRHEIKVERRDDTAETQLGRQLTFENIIQ
jgi:hypothetical protein